MTEGIEFSEGGRDLPDIRLLTREEVTAHGIVVPWNTSNTLTQFSPDRRKLHNAALAVENPFAYYMHEINRFPRLTPDQEIELAQTVERGMIAYAHLMEGSTSLDTEARQRLNEYWNLARLAKRDMVLCNLRLVAFVARQYVNSRGELLDLIQEGTLGLDKGMDTYDWREDKYLATPAISKIRHALRSYISRDKPISLPRRAPSEIAEIIATREELKAVLGRTPSREELAEACELSLSRVKNRLAIENRASIGSLSLLAGSADTHEHDREFDATKRYAEDPQGTEHIQDLLDWLDLEALLPPTVPVERLLEITQDILTERGYAVLSRRLALGDFESLGGRTITEIAKEFGVGYQAIQKSYSSAIARLQKYLPTYDPNRRLPYSGRAWTPKEES